MGHTLLCKLEFILVLYSLLHSGHTEDAVLTFEPNWSTFFVGESLTFKCDMKEGRKYDWTYTLKTRDWTPYPGVTQQDLEMHPLHERDSGDYQCCGRRKGSDYTKCSNRVSIRVLDRARATLTAATTTVSVGDRVTLICSVEKSAGWKYEWFRRTSHTSEDTINDGLNGNIRVSQGGIYRCRGFRGEPAVYSDPSDEVTIQITFSVTQKPSWSQIFRGERITLTCEVQGGEGVQWEYEWRTPQSQTFRTKQKDWTITASISGDYSCKSRPTDDSYSATNWSEALRLSFLDPPKAQISRSGGTLTCSVNPSSSGWSYYFYREKNQEVLTVQNTDFHSNREIRVSQGGVYKCRGGRGEPVYHTEFSDPVTIVGEFLCVFFLHY
ncbi:titin-like isoform X2 [Oryzias latipes]|uniref:titin-like isoform X2 n=1 Tax=Oryzias latipes TaxID=8090 RepID=UPI000CE19B75|nr:titin-like isoform X2 [Oryzias latipes]